MILNLYIAVKDEADRQKLYEVLRSMGYPVYDATHADPYTASANAGKWPTLECIEADIECK